MASSHPGLVLMALAAEVRHHGSGARVPLSDFHIGRSRARVGILQKLVSFDRKVWFGDRW
jgi:hypothetical protein